MGQRYRIYNGFAIVAVTGRRALVPILESACCKLPSVEQGARGAAVVRCVLRLGGAVECRGGVLQ